MAPKRVGHAAATRTLRRYDVAGSPIACQGIHLRGFGQKIPKQEFTREAFVLFSHLLDVVTMEVTRILMSVRIQTQNQAADAAQAFDEQAYQKRKRHLGPSQRGREHVTGR